MDKELLEQAPFSRLFTKSSDTVRGSRSFYEQEKNGVASRNVQHAIPTNLRQPIAQHNV